MMAFSQDMIKQMRAAIVGCAVGIGGTIFYETQIAAADIEEDCSSSVVGYQCKFFNKGPGSGALCIKVALKRTLSEDSYLKPTNFKKLVGETLCSGVLTKGQESVVKGTGFWANGSPTNGADYCTAKGKERPIDGCEVDRDIIARTR
jgi:hypothetical protein